MSETQAAAPATGDSLKLGRVLARRAFVPAIVENRERRRKAIEELEAARTELIELIEKATGLRSDLTVRELCELAGITPWHYYRILRGEVASRSRYRDGARPEGGQQDG